MLPTDVSPPFFATFGQGADSSTSATVERTVWVVNGQIEGPLIEANQGEPSLTRLGASALPLLRADCQFFRPPTGDTINVHVKNNLSNGTNGTAIHWHVSRALCASFSTSALTLASSARRESPKTTPCGPMDLMEQPSAPSLPVATSPTASPSIARTNTAATVSARRSLQPPLASALD